MTSTHVTYFSGEALWTYLNTPFLYARSDFSTEGIPPVDVDGETRRLRAIFPETVKSHTREQVSCFGLNYAYDYVNVDGIIVPATWRVYAYEGDYQLVKEPLLVASTFRSQGLISSSRRAVPKPVLHRRLRAWHWPVELATAHPSSRRRT